MTVRFPDVDGAVLVGGASRRMGRDKAALQLAGASFAARVAGRLESLCDTVWLVGDEPPSDARGRRCGDAEGPPCALRGLAGALEASRAARVLVVATDLPLVSERLLGALLSLPAADVVAPRDPEHGAQPLCAAYRREVALPRAKALLAAGRLAVRGLLDELETTYLEGETLRRADPEGLALRNVNTPEDLTGLEALVSRLQMEEGEKR